MGVCNGETDRGIYFKNREIVFFVCNGLCHFRKCLREFLAVLINYIRFGNHGLI